jgi:hypothetical protein
MWSAGGDVGYDAPTSYAYVQGEMCCEMLKHSTQHPIHVYFPDHLRLSSFMCSVVACFSDKLKRYIFILVYCSACFIYGMFVSLS